jgi:hypothetical protein
VFSHGEHVECVLLLCDSEDGSDTYLRNISNHLQKYVSSQARRPQSTYEMVQKFPVTTKFSYSVSLPEMPNDTPNGKCFKFTVSLCSKGFACNHFHVGNTVINCGNFRWYTECSRIRYTTFKFYCDQTNNNITTQFLTEHLLTLQNFFYKCSVWLPLVMRQTSRRYSNSSHSLSKKATPIRGVALIRISYG